MQFTSFVSLTPFDEHQCDVEAIFLPGDPDTGVSDDWDVFVTIDCVDVTYDISKADRLRLINEAIEHQNDIATDIAIDQWETNRSYDL